MAWISVLQHLQVECEIGTVAHGPQQCICIVWVNVLVDGDDHFAARAQQGCRAIQGTPYFCLWHFSVDHNGDHFAQIGQWLMHDHFFDAFDAHCFAQVIEENRLEGHALDQA